MSLEETNTISNSPKITSIAPIPLTITQPKNNSAVTQETITVSGQTSPNAEIFINELELHADASGNFSSKLVLNPGDNEVDVIANDANGNYNGATINVTYNIPE